MGQLDSKLSKDDLDTLVEAMHDWEAIGNHEFHVLNMVKSAPVPPDDHESHEFIVNIKKHFSEREKEIRKTREMRQEKAIFLKAKLMLIKQDAGVGQLFEEARSGATEAAAAAPEMTAEQKNDLELAREFIKDLGVWSHYEKFLAERKTPPAE